MPILSRAWDVNAVTWNAFPAHRSTFSGASPTASGWWSVDVTADVAALVAGTLAQYGWGLSAQLDADCIDSPTAFTNTFGRTDCALRLPVVVQPVGGDQPRGRALRLSSRS